LWLLALFLVDGLVLLSAQVFRRQLPQEQALPFQTVIFVTGFFITTAVYYIRRPRPDPRSLTFGALLGAANLGNYLFLIIALTILPGVVVYPSIAAGEVGLMALAGVLIWKEPVGWRSWLGIGLAVSALILIQLGRTG
jgi:multidrug transporter EmrE-like cation transporter